MITQNLFKLYDFLIQHGEKYNDDHMIYLSQIIHDCDNDKYISEKQLNVLCQIHNRLRSVHEQDFNGPLMSTIRRILKELKEQLI